MVRINLALLFLVFMLSNTGVSKASSEIPYWAGLQEEKQDGKTTYRIRFSEDGKKFTFGYTSEENAVRRFGGAECNGSVTKNGIFHDVKCGDLGPRALILDEGSVESLRYSIENYSSGFWVYKRKVSWGLKKKRNTKI